MYRMYWAELWATPVPFYIRTPLDTSKSRTHCVTTLVLVCSPSTCTCSERNIHTPST